MRILITGCTAMQVNSPRRVNRIITSLPALVAALEDMGHEVDWRAVDVGEDLVSNYDRAIVCLQPMASWGTGYMGGCLWTWYQFRDTDHLYFTADDWQVRGIQGSISNLAKREDYFQKTIWSHWEKRCTGPGIYRDILKGVLQTWHEGFQSGEVRPEPMIVPTHGGKGDLSLMRLNGFNLQAYDPTAYTWKYPLDEPISFRNKEKHWVHASLTKKDAWVERLSTNWPVVKYGNVRSGEQKLSEDRLQQVYAQSWGILSAKHNCSGSGWWRVRFQMAARAESIIYCEPSENVWGEAYAVTPREVEAMDGGQLIHAALDQKEAFWNLAWSSEKIKEFLSCVIK